MSRRSSPRRLTLERLDARCVLDAESVIAEVIPAPPEQEELPADEIAMEAEVMAFAEVASDKLPADDTLMFFAFSAMAVDGEVAEGGEGGEIAWTKAAEGDFEFLPCDECLAASSGMVEMRSFAFGFEATSEPVEWDGESEFWTEGEVLPAEFDSPVLYFMAGGDASEDLMVQTRALGELPEGGLDGEFVELSDDLVVAFEASGDDIILQSAFTITWHNGALPEDVNGDGEVSPLDGLLLLEYLRNNGPGDLQGDSAVKVDVNDDGVMTALDIVIVANHLIYTYLQVELAAAQEALRFAPDFLPDALPEDVREGMDSGTSLWEGDVFDEPAGAQRVRWSDDLPPELADEAYFTKLSDEEAAALDTSLTDPMAVDAYFDELAAA